MIKPGERFNLERLAESLIALMIISAISGIMITIRLNLKARKDDLCYICNFNCLCNLLCIGSYCDRISWECKLKRGEEYL